MSFSPPGRPKADARGKAERIFQTPAGADLRTRAFDVLENALVDSYAHLELEECLRFLAQYPVTPYQYDFSSQLSRGERPSAERLKELYGEKFGATINLCAETPGGDGQELAKAGLAEDMQSFHIPVLDGCPPASEQVVELLNLVADLKAEGVRAYLHCEAGKTRTGVMVACVRMGTMGWGIKDALTEAGNFGCTIPMQHAFIETLGAQLTARAALGKGKSARHPELSPYPKKPPGSVKATEQQLSMTLASLARP